MKYYWWCKFSIAVSAYFLVAGYLPHWFWAIVLAYWIAELQTSRRGDRIGGGCK